MEDTNGDYIDNLRYIYIYISLTGSWSFLLKDFKDTKWPGKFTVRLFKRSYLFTLNRGQGRKKDGEKHQCVVASCMLPTGTRPTTQACALTGNSTAVLWFSGQHSVHWATPTRAINLIFKRGNTSPYKWRGKEYFFFVFLSPIVLILFFY